MTRRLLIAATTVAALLLPGPAGAQAVDHSAGNAAKTPHGAHFALVPVGEFPKGYFVVEGRAGERIHEALLVTNQGDTAGTVRLAAVDATTGQTSGAVYLDRSAPRHGVGRWIALSRGELTLAPHQTVRVPFTVSVPSDVTPGEHLGGLVAEGTAPATPIVKRGKAGALAIRVRQLSIIALQANVAGPRVAKVRLTSVSSGWSNGFQWIYLALRNDGNIMIKPHGTIAVKARDGRTVDTTSFKLDTFLPQTAISYPIVVRGKEIPPGDYHATIDIAPDSGGPVHATLPLTVKEDSTAKIYRSPEPHAPPTTTAAHSTPTAHSDHPAYGDRRRDHFRLPRLPLLAGGVALLLALLALLAWLPLRTAGRRRRNGGETPSREPQQPALVTAHPQPLADALTVSIGPPLVEAIAQRAAELMLAKLAEQPAETSISPYMTVSEAAAYLRCSPKRVHALLSSGRLTRRKDGRRTLVSRAELDAYLNNEQPASLRPRTRRNAA